MAGVHVAGLEARLRHERSGGQNTPQAARDPADHRLTRHPRHRLPGIHRIADLFQRLEQAAAGRAQHPLHRVAPHTAGNTGVRDGGAGIDAPAQRVAAHGLNNAVAVLPCRKARAHADHQRCVGDASAQIAFGQNGIHHYIRVQIPDYPSVRVGQDRDLPPRQCGFCAGRAVAAHCGDSLHFTAPRPHGLTKGRLPSHRRGVFQIGHCHGKAAPTEPPANAGGNVSGSSYQNQHFIWLSFNWVT